MKIGFAKKPHIHKFHVKVSMTGQADVDFEGDQGVKNEEIFQKMPRIIEFTTFTYSLSSQCEIKIL